MLINVLIACATCHGVHYFSLFYFWVRRQLLYKSCLRACQFEFYLCLSLVRVRLVFYH